MPAVTCSHYTPTQGCGAPGEKGLAGWSACIQLHPDRSCPYKVAVERHLEEMKHGSAMARRWENGKAVELF